MRLHQTKNLLHSKRTDQQLKRQPREWKKIFANHISDKGLISKIFTKLILNQQKPKEPNSKSGKGLKQTLLKSRHPNGQEVLNTTHHQNELSLHTVRMALSKRTKDKKCKCGEKGTIGENVHWFSNYESSYRFSSINENRTTI